MGHHTGSAGWAVCVLCLALGLPIFGDGPILERNAGPDEESAGGGGIYSVWVDSQNAVAEARIFGVTSTAPLGPLPGTVSITRAVDNEFAFASVTTAYTSSRIQASAIADVDHAYQTGYSEGTISVSFVLPEPVSYTRFVVTESIPFSGVPVMAFAVLTRGGVFVWNQAPSGGTCSAFPVPAECNYLRSGTYSLELEAEARGQPCGGCGEYSVASVDLTFTPCADGDDDDRHRGLDAGHGHR